MSGPPTKTKRVPHAPPVFVPHTDDAKHVRRAFEQDAEHPERRETLTPEQLRHWADTGECPESSD